MTIPAQKRPLLFATLTAALSVLGSFALSRLADPVPPNVSPTAPAISATPAHGRQLFVQSCAHCHGDDARGSGEDGDGPDLFRLAVGNARIAAVIRTGIPHEMPSFAKKHSARDIADLTAYLRTLK